MPIPTATRTPGPSSTTGVDATGRAEFPPVPPGRYMVTASSPAAWPLESVTVDGRDVTDRPFEVSRDEPDLLITFGDRPASIVGTVRPSRGANRTDLAFPPPGRALAMDRRIRQRTRSFEPFAQARQEHSRSRHWCQVLTSSSPRVTTWTSIGRTESAASIGSSGHSGGSTCGTRRERVALSSGAPMSFRRRMVLASCAALALTVPTAAQRDTAQPPIVEVVSLPSPASSPATPQVHHRSGECS